MADKSGYEIRSDILHLAHQIVANDAHMRYEASKKIVRVGEDALEVKEWTPFTVDQILEIAERLNSFIQKK